MVLFHFSKDSKCLANDILIYAPLHIIKYNTLARYRYIVPRYNNFNGQKYSYQGI
jgi:hypothetical protein